MPRLTLSGIPLYPYSNQVNSIPRGTVSRLYYVWASIFSACSLPVPGVGEWLNGPLRVQRTGVKATPNRRRSWDLKICPDPDLKTIMCPRLTNQGSMDRRVPELELCT